MDSLSLRERVRVRDKSRAYPTGREELTHFSLREKGWG
jgi:hypothetical protein